MKIKKNYIITAAVALVLVIAVFIGNILNLPSAYVAENYSENLPSGVAPVEAVLDANINAPGYSKIAQGGNAALYFNFSEGVFYLQNLDSGFKWRSDIGKEMLPEHDFEDRPLNFLFSAVLSNKQNGNTLVVNTTMAESSNFSGLKNGLAIKYSFLKYGIEITIQLFVDESGAFYCRVPQSEIVENGEYYLLNIDVLPFFGASVAGEKGYILYPDGCGALYNLGDIDSGVGTVISTAVYSDHVLDIDTMLENEIKNINTVRLPFFGTKRGEEAMSAFVCEGDISATISLSPYGCVYDLNRVYSTSVYRRVQSATSSDGTTYFDTEKEMRGNDYCVRYTLLSGSNANYSGMAQDLRKYMLESGRLPEKSVDSYDAYLELLMGVESKSLLGYSYEATTTVEQADSMLKDLLTGNTRASVSLLGWQKEGYGVYPSTVSVAGDIGGKSALKKLKNERADINLGYSTVVANTTSTGSKIRRDAVSSLRGITLMDASEKTFVMNPVKVGAFYNDVFDKLIGYESDGILLSGCGNLIYDDYNKKGGVTRRQTATVLLDMFKKTVDADRKLVLENANSYSWKFASMLTSMPEADSGYSVLKNEVPFIYMVLNGSVAYSLTTPGNFSADFSLTKLKWLEFGAVPYFVLTYDNSEEMVGTAADKMFSTQYSEKQQQVKEALVLFEDVAEKRGDATIVSHTILTDDVRVTEYSNGVRVYVNYSDSKYTDSDITVEPFGYTVVS